MNVLSTVVGLIHCIGVVYGQLVQPGEYSFVTSLGTAAAHGVCLGTILSEYWILSTVTCGYDGVPLLVQYGAIQTPVQTEKLSPVSEIVRHPMYVGELEYSINLIRLRDPIKYDNVTQPVKLVRKNKVIPVNSVGLVISWSPKVELEVHNSTFVGRTWPQLFKTTGNFEPSPPIFGSPLIYDGYQIGVLVFNDYFNFHYLDVSQHLDWIYRTVTFYEFKEEYSYLQNVEPNCTAIPDSNDILDICCTYPFGYEKLDTCIHFV